MSTSLKRPPAFAAASLRPDASSESRAAPLREARASAATARYEARPAREAVLRPIDLERRARFARVEDSPRGA
jgi:hypothetical protein